MFGNVCKSDDKVFLTRTKETDSSSRFSLSLVKDLDVNFRPSKVVVDCVCILPGFRVTESGEWFIDFSVEWKDRLIVPVSFAFYEDKVEPSRTEAVYLVRSFAP